MLTDEDRGRIERAVKEAEAATRGEFVCIISDEASDYSEVPLLWASALALLAPLLPLTLFAFMLQIREAFMGWIVNPEVSAAAPASAVAIFATIQAAAFLILFLLISIPSVRRAMTPRGLKQRFVRQRALEHFISKGLANTAERTGVLLYVSTKDKCVELVADEGINSMVTADTWSSAVKALVSDVKKGRVADGLVSVIQSCGRELATHFPPHLTDTNELPDAVTELPATQES